MHEINEKRERFGEYQRLSVCLCAELQSREDSRTFSIQFSVNSSAIPYCPPGKSVSKTQKSATRRDLDWSAASARLQFDGDDAVLRNAVRMPSHRGHRSLSAAAALFLCGPTLSLMNVMKHEIYEYRIFSNLIRTSLCRFLKRKKS